MNDHVFIYKIEALLGYQQPSRNPEHHWIHCKPPVSPVLGAAWSHSPQSEKTSVEISFDRFGSRKLLPFCGLIWVWPYSMALIYLNYRPQKRMDGWKLKCAPNFWGLYHNFFLNPGKASQASSVFLPAPCCTPRLRCTVANASHHQMNRRGLWLFGKVWVG